MADTATLKPALHARCRQWVKERIRSTELAIAGTRAAANDDTKSSAGDKHEVARAMAHQELEKQEVILRNLHLMRTALDRIDPDVPQTQPVPGALVRTDLGLFYIAVGLGRLVVDGQEYWVVSKDAPLVNAMKDAPPGGIAFFNGKAYRMLGIG